MGLRKVFSKKDPSEQELRDSLTKSGITTKSNSSGTREEKFGAFKQYAQERAGRKPGFAPVNPYASANLNTTGGNPYANGNDNGSNNNMGNNSPYGSSSNNSPYGSSSNQSNPYGSSSNQSNPYGTNTSNSSNGYGSGKASPYGTSSAYSNPSSTSNSNAYNQSSNAPNPYSTQRRANPYGSATPKAKPQPRVRDYDEESSLDLNKMPSHQIGASTQAKREPKSLYGDDATLDLNALPEEDDLNLEIDDLPQEQEVNSEDEEIEAIRQDIRFVKQESIASTRNTLKMAQEADASATNTLGMLGSQSERLYNAEQNLLLADTQTKIADSKVSELNRLNRSIFIPAYGNPFNKKSRLRNEENKIKSEKSMEKYMREQNRTEMYRSEQRIKEGITNNATSSELHQKYRGEKDLLAAKRYQFENDSEDDEIEKELATNLDQIGLYAKKLKLTAQTMGIEVESQNARLKKIEEDADRLDINVHMNTTRLSNIR